MNFLAHIYLSFDQAEVSLGNFIGDHMKGKDYKKYPMAIQQGVLLHRAIDQFTDAHPLYRKSCKRIFHVQGHYSRVIIDVFYDYFLAANWAKYHKTELSIFADQFYNVLESRLSSLPAKTQHLAPYMIQQNWLLAYRSKQGIDRILKAMHRRTSYDSKMDQALLDLIAHEPSLQSDFDAFFPELIIFSRHKLNQLKTNI